MTKGAITLAGENVSFLDIFEEALLFTQKSVSNHQGDFATSLSWSPKFATLTKRSSAVFLLKSITEM